MIIQNIEEIIPQLPGEPTPSYQRLLIMLKEGISTLPKLEEYLEKEEPQLQVSFQYLKKCSAKYNWKERRNKYNTIREQELQEEVEELFQQLNNNSIHDMQEYIQELQNTFNEIITRHKKGEYQPSYMLKMFKDYILCYRQATEIYYINARHKLEPDTEQEETRTINEEIVDKDILNADNMNERNNLLQDLVNGGKQ